MQISFYSESEFLSLISKNFEEQGLVEAVKVEDANPIEVESLSFDLVTVAHMAAVFVALVEAAKVAKAIYAAASKSRAKKKRLEFVGPMGRDHIDTDGKTEREIEVELKIKLPFLR